jgi:hypothetical protein
MEQMYPISPLCDLSLSAGQIDHSASANSICMIVRFKPSLRKMKGTPCHFLVLGIGITPLAIFEVILEQTIY